MSNAEKSFAVIEKHPLFSGLADVEAAVLRLSGARQSYRRGEQLRRREEPFLTFGLVLRGLIHVSMDDMDGAPLLMASVGAGDSFGESLAFLRTRESPVFITAAEDSEVLWLSAEPLHNGGDGRDSLTAALAERFSALLATRALMQNDRIQILSKPRIRERLTTFFAQCERKYKSRTFCIPFDRAALAVYLGVDRSALSRELSRMRAEGMLDFFRSSFRLLP